MPTMNELEMRNYAAIITEVCLGVTEGTKLRIGGEMPQRELMLAVARRAYELGASAVRIDYTDARLGKLQAELARDGYLDEVPSPLAALTAVYADEGWDYLSVVGEEAPSLFEGADSTRLQRIGRARSIAVKKLHEAVRTNSIAWNVVPGPTAAWAESIFKNAGRDPGADPAQALWKALVPILRLDSANPAAAVRAHMEGLEARARKLDALGLRELRFSGPGTELCVPLSTRSRWIGGGSTTSEGRRFFPNLPTEEVFTTPDWRGVEGHAACTRPFMLYGQRVEGAWLKFASGELVEHGAAANAAALARFVSTDPGAKRLGEVALVDASGPIFQSGLVFGNGLIDENAACHIALGSAYEEAYADIATVPEDKRIDEGYNDSMVHEDIMIGSEEVEVRGVDASGISTILISRGRFAI